jgi:predicted hydrocarbon binding protein
VLPLPTKLKIGVPAVARIFTQFSDQTSWVEEHDDHFLYYINPCSMCWGRKTDRPVCYIAVGLLQEALRWVSGGLEFRIDEIECIAMGSNACIFKIDKEPIK